MTGKESVVGQRGFTLLEVLVAVLILSVGLLGIAGMQLKALQSAHLSYQRSVASLAAQDARERLWFEMAKRLDEGNESLCPDTNLDELTNNASRWHQQWDSVLPGLKQGAIEHVPSNGCAFEITIDWNEERFDGEGDVSLLIYRFRLPVIAREGA